MRYLRKGREHWLVNGKSEVRCEHVLTKPSPTSPGRFLKVLQVVEVKRSNPANPISRGMMLAVSFPGDKLNALEYEWHRVEESQVPLTITDHKANVEAASKRRPTP